MKIGIIGVGKMASAIIKGLKQTPHELIISGSSLERSKEIAEQLTLPYAMSHQDLIDQVDLVILGIKPQLFETVLKPLHFKQPIISMAAGISLQRLATFVGQDLPLLRIMPNMNAQILQSSTALTGNALVSQELQARVRDLTDSFGSTFDISEKDFDTFTALAGSSPAYIYLFIEALAKAGVKNGMPKAKALEIVTQTVLASASNLKTSSQSPHDLIDAICSPGGTTIAGLMELERLGLTTTVSSAIDKTIDKAKSL
ncbi:pyrroline-5-carboxylate reductase [Streptococcus pyogenes]|uniref:pyrroline-5-carboxylate reductase n=1 Tax=Streptococcus pyogenes TaxID=1314 RepID=UPI000252E7C9|nr:pyrroline-5-carboxylate reductase [Streptococcus pyogenes]AFC65495.1 pyrroline-5-carboxylate reductase protein ProC [Streptococcus pyogenes MGAS15252]HER4563883.1 pyrroline-5-carboxylate reductase [Streptococcus pyogenes NGAS639]HER4697900.1 pyrroline-5-carboxylate reductase [Streptococcus pyogenes NGAS339]HER4709410.1 pyrroline-5-carboxylate reductase [Streptococcus pyogenes NGAS321]AFC67368.1 pyrroline-5-carboxylate reductase protein ProC [Streptococcus pyogenes MGAS1882]